MFARLIFSVKRHMLFAIMWLDCHPRTGWYIAAMVTLNVLLNIFDLVH